MGFVSSTDQKNAVLRLLVSRAIKVCSPEELENELGVIKSIFLNNAFPASVIDRTILRVKISCKELVLVT